ncbi:MULTISPECIES: Csu type fimbrial protein [Nitrospirillum]|uniref:Spore coat protein n=2 Tax=Nitrospirillum TaxID=1543705 RepID=A0A248JQW7_9PROT|nr:spore coat U domain-containing protein [Nitrospirillum amazonense]ASG20478.1 spore coat protein [Nitrospirillum amazonense CBAmc]MEC4591259.1 spore coat U domain-containing protein [Nitrospirillum amazonense]TWB30753.1 spore coat protein U-like protein [Nitrospirillum amazonense]TWB34885.1 spore coat protein U-like protein [Nitrospirillum amazonense]
MTRRPLPQRRRTRGWRTWLPTALLLALALLLIPHRAQAQCTVSVTTLNYGTYIPFRAFPTNSTGGVTVDCTAALPAGYTVTLSSGNSGSYSSRRMLYGGYNLNYQLFTDSLRSNIWGDGSGSTRTVVGDCLSPCHTVHPIYGSMPAGQIVQPGAYSDTITVTVIY